MAYVIIMPKHRCTLTFLALPRVTPLRVAVLYVPGTDSSNVPAHLNLLTHFQCTRSFSISSQPKHEIMT